MLLYIVRHAWAEERDAERYPNDDLRPLTGEGKKRFAKMVERLVDGGFRPTLIATSPLVRCRQTADLIVKHSPDAAKIVELDALRPGSDFELRWWIGRPGSRIKQLPGSAMPLMSATWRHRSSATQERQSASRKGPSPQSSSTANRPAEPAN